MNVNCYHCDKDFKLMKANGFGSIHCPHCGVEYGHDWLVEIDIKRKLILVLNKLLEKLI